MSAFITSLLNRHQGHAELVQPRAQTRFEPDRQASAQAAAELRESPSVYSEVHAPQHESSTHRFDTVTSDDDAYQQQTDDRAIDIDSDNTTAHSPHPFDHSQPQHTDFSRRENRQQTWQVATEDTAPGQTRPESSGTDPLTADTQGLAKLVDVQLQRSVHDLLTRMAPKSEKHFATPDQVVAPAIDNAAVGNRESDSFRVQTAGYRGEAAEPAAASVNDRELVIDTGLKPDDLDNTPPRRQADTLMPPDWLQEFERQFQRRWQSHQTQAEATPTVNVTIGRIEVRATQSEPSPTSKQTKKPRGVMSLDDYLKTRNRTRGDSA